jgi:signal transduction histidine kinase/CheY-like chemotaxis protein
MHISKISAFADASRRLISSCQGRLRSPEATKTTAHVKQLTLALPNFDHEEELLFWRERQVETLDTLKWALRLGALGFLAFIFLDILTKDLSIYELICRPFIVVILCLLFIRLDQHAQPQTQVAITAKIGAGITIINLALVLMIHHNPAYYSEIWSGLLPIYFFIYGQLFMTLSETVLYGWLAMLILPLSGYAIGVDTKALINSVLILLIANLFGFCTRYQLEFHSRRAFQARRKAENSAQSKHLFLQQFSHNLRQPLQALSCFSSVLETACTDIMDSHLQHIVSRLGGSIDELNNAFNHILHIANLETGKQQPVISVVDINILLAGLEEQFAPQAAKRGIQLKVILRSKPPFNVASDACLLRQILSNLIDNAIKYTRQGWVLVSAVKISANRLKIHVYDTGIGIPDQQKPDIFKDFYRGPRRRDDPAVYGLGIGLAYVLKAAEALPGHSLAFYSKANRGSDFSLCLPVADQTNPESAITPNHPSLMGSFVFIVDDDLDVLQALAEQLAACGCVIQTATSKAETIAMLADNIRTPDLLITDFYLENQETAHDIIAAMDSQCGAVPILILSAHAISVTDREQWPENTLLLRKPASAGVLMELMAKAMRK